MRAFERLQAGIICRVFFHPQWCQDAERIANTWMANWDCFLEFRLSTSNPRSAPTGLGKCYIDWYLLNAWRNDITASSNLDRLTLNVEMLETLDAEIQNEILEHVTAAGNTLSEKYKLQL